MFWKTLLVTLFVVGVFAEIEIQGLNNVNKQQVMEKLTQMCAKNNASENAAQDIQTAAQNALKCLQEIVNFEQLKQEIEDAKPNGALDEVFKKYCAKTPEIKTCIHTLFDATVPCLDEASKVHINSAKNGTDQLIDFVCYKDGDRIALFIAEQGPECFVSKQEPIRECFKKAQDGYTTETAQSMTLPEKCGKFDDMSECIVKAVETCNTPTPSNMAESLFKYVRKSSPCHTALPKN